MGRIHKSADHKVESPNMPRFPAVHLARASRHPGDQNCDAVMANTVVTDDARAGRNFGLFIIWPKARSQQDSILADLERRFKLLSVYEFHWTRSLAVENFQRFYSDAGIRGAYHALYKGMGPFILITLIDPQPRFEFRETSKGRRKVNTRLYDAKMQYRSWTGKFQIHCSETAWETDRDLGIIFGTGAQSYLAPNQSPWSHNIEMIEQDPIGASGWRSMSELFWSLNRSVNYAALWYERPLSYDFLGHGHQDVDLLTDDYRTIHALVNTRQPPRTVPNGGRFRISVDGKDFKIGIRFVGDRYFDPQWAKDILANRVFDPRGFYRPSDRDCFGTLAYHALVHSPTPTIENKRRLVVTASNLGIGGWTPDALNDSRRVMTLLDQFLDDRGYSYVEPLDKTVYYNFGHIERDRPLKRHLTSAIQRQLAMMNRRLTMPILATYWRTRDKILLRFPELKPSPLGR